MAGPARPNTSRDMLQFLDGAPIYLGALVSTGTAVNNNTTAVPFFNVALGPVLSPPVPGYAPNYTNTLAGKMLLMQTTAAGVMLPSSTATVTLANQNQPVTVGTVPGILLGANERVIILMQSAMGWLQWLPSTGSANLLVWELS